MNHTPKFTGCHLYDMIVGRLRAQGIVCLGHPYLIGG